ncbi:MAG: phosphomannose isomerase type II C-terminal cupin domain [Minisyncoccia bacterium]
MSTKLPFTVEKPWGEFREFTLDEKVTVKLIKVNKGESLSLQEHHKRSEFWKILKGTPEVTDGDVVTQAKIGDEFSVPAGVAHRISAPHDEVEFLEISHGEFDENDIERLEDKYGRA